MAQTGKAYTSREHPVMQRRSSTRYRFALTPLADAMFQLLIFFMLTSSLTPYSLLTIRSGSEPGNTASDPSADPSDEETITPGENARIWSVEQDQIVINNEPYAPSDLPALAAAVGQDETAEVILLMGGSAQVQDLTSVLEALTNAGVSAVKIAKTGDDT